ncbi:glycosyltransferase family 2 protein [Saccharicrinis aurantiacus]|uniref:glycosyltransferase family 2 protein n=1 Tax=Saccharicrinis aurantiacus TaxID=1849719 RepID=UPI00094FAEF9|nr:glycosyltransferase family 2 protein [Saccharicrinis aurantiacus]
MQTINRSALVSILIPLYNSELFITETIQSVLNQTYTHWECIIVDDGSTDNSYNIAKGFESDKIKIYQQVNSGACVARNLAFEKSKGEYIQYLDADDLLSPNKIEAQLKLLSDKPNSISSCTWGRFYNSIEDVKWEQQTINKDYTSPINWLIDSWNGLGMAQTSVWLTLRLLIEKAGPWNEKLMINQDGEFFSRVLMQADSIMYSDNSKVYYRSGISTSISQGKINEVKAASLLASYLLYKKTVTKYLDNLIVRKALANNLLNFIYQNYEFYPHLAFKAENEFKALNVGKMWSVGGKRFKQFASIVGFKNALRLKSVF